jgi:4-hydroxy-tetrahydrodipicolinate synthase
MSTLAEMITTFGSRISILTGADDLLLQSFAAGCSGAILALGNIAPRMCVDLFEALQRGELAMARGLYFKLLPLARTLGSPENFPAPVKEAVNLMGRPAGPCRSPITSVGPQERQRIQQALKVAGLIDRAHLAM